MGFPIRSIREVITWHQSDMTEKQIQQVVSCSQSTHPDVIRYNLLRLFLEKRLTGDENQQAHIIKNYISRLSGITELEVFEMVENFIENYKGDFAPKFSHFKSWLIANNIYLDDRCT